MNQYDNRATRLRLLRISYQHVMKQGRRSVRINGLGDTCCVYRADNGDQCAAGPFIREYDPRMGPVTWMLLVRDFRDKLDPAAAENAGFVRLLQKAHDDAKGADFLASYQANLVYQLDCWHMSVGEAFTLADAAMSPESIHTLLVATAICIEAHPEKYSFGKPQVPEEGWCGCMLGLLGGIAGMQTGTSYDDVSAQLLGVQISAFESRVNDLVGTDWIIRGGKPDGCPLTAAKGLRLYADKYHAEEVA